MKLTPDQIAFIHSGLCDADMMASADALVEHIRDLDKERDTLLSLVHEKVSLAMTAVQTQCSYDDGTMERVPSEVNDLLNDVLDLLDAGGADKARDERQKLIDERQKYRAECIRLEQLVTHWVDKCSRLGAERDRLKAALENVAGMKPGMCGGYVETDCEKCEDMITICASAIGKDVKE